MTKKQVLLTLVALFAFAWIAMFITMTPASQGLNVPQLSLKWFVYVTGMGLIFVLLPFLLVFLLSLLLLSLFRRSEAKDLSFKIAAGVTLAWIALGTYGQMSTQAF